MMCSARSGGTGPGRESGQALVPALLFLVVGGAALYLAFNSLQLTSAKIKLQNTADASAYAAAVLQARDYNFSAYTNRAMVANQAAVAQAISLKSFVDMLDDHAAPDSPSDRLAKKYSGDAQGWLTRKAQARAILHPIRQRWDASLPGMASNLDTIIATLSGAQGAYHEATLVGVPGIAGDVAHANEPNTRVVDGAFDDPLSRSELGAWRTFTATFDPRTGRDNRFADIVTDAQTLGEFAIRRPVDEVASGLVPGCWGPVDLRARMEGGTQLRPDLRGWQAMDGAMTRFSTAHECVESWTTWVWVPDGGADAGDTGSTHGHWESREQSIVKPGTAYEGAEGYAGAGNGNVMRYQSWYGYGGYLNFGYPSTSPGAVSPAMQAQYLAGPGMTMDEKGGLQPYRDLEKQGEGRAAPRITVRLARAVDTTVSDRRLLGGGRMAMSPSERPLTAVASGQAYFARPDEKGLRYVYGLLRNASAWSRLDGKTEYPSLFSPYWEARLAPVPDAARALTNGSGG